MRRLLPVALAACGLGGGSDGGGSDHLPVSGAGPYGKLTDFELETPIDEPFVISDFGADLTDPSAVARGDGFRVFYTRRATGAAPEIWRSDLESLAVAPSAATSLLAGSAPSVIADGARLVMYYEAEGGGIARAESTDGGDTFRTTGNVLDDASQPAALGVSGQVWLYFTRPSIPGIFFAWSTDGVAFTVTGGGRPVLEGSLSEPAAAGGKTPAGTLRIGLFFTATDADGHVAIGYAGSTDGQSFFVNPEPILDPEAPDERGPGVVLEPSRAVLFFTQPGSARMAIAAATSP